jgi:membrane-associated phospholipid phosphatase
LGRNTTVLLTTALGAGVAVSLFDSKLLSVTNSVAAGGELQRSSAIGGIVGGPGPISLGVALYAVGKGSGDLFLANTGREVVRAVLYSGAVTAVAKGAVGRARPFASPGDADEYAPGRGFLDSKRSSFPSGHTTAAFAAATVLAREINTAHPSSRWVVNPLLFGAASFVGWSRVYDHQHWPSDVLVGAALGSITGYEVVAHAHGERSPLGGAFLSHLRLGPNPKGLDVGWSLR